MRTLRRLLAGVEALLRAARHSFALILLGFALPIAHASSFPNEGVLLPQPQLDDPGIPRGCLNWGASLTEVALDPRAKTPRLIATVSVQIPKVCGAPIFGTRKIPMNAAGKYQFQTFLKGQRTRARFLLIDNQGIPRRVHADVVYPHFSAALVARASRFSLTAGLGVTSLRYSESGLPDFATIALTPKLGANVWLVPGRWSVGGNVFLNAVSFAPNSPHQIRFLGANLRASYHSPWPHSPWSLRLSAGFYYNTSLPQVNLQDPNVDPAFVKSGGAYGFAELFGPQIFPSIGYRIGQRHQLESYVKFSPVSSGLSLLSLSNHELAYGLSYTHLKPGIPSPRAVFSLSIDLGTLLLSIDGVTARAETVTFGLSLPLLQ